jgi:hypothetical protein
MRMARAAKLSVDRYGAGEIGVLVGGVAITSFFRRGR